MITIRQERVSDAEAREALLDEAFGENRTRKSSQRLRDGRFAAEGLSFVATDADRTVGTARLWNVDCGGRPALLLGPVAVACERRSEGIGAALIEHALAAARARGHAAVILVGDAAYHGRFGFTAEKTGALAMPGPFERHRLLGLELVPRALDGADGVIAASGRPVPKPRRKAA
jgi:predicted N-acetyltransferase YhbS